MVKKLVVFPNDALLDYYNKGEIKERYFNPENWFDEIHIISLFDKEIEEQKVQKLAGNAKLIIHNFGKVNLKNYKSYEEKIMRKICDINPSIIRSYNDSYFTVFSGKIDHSTWVADDLVSLIKG